MTLIIYAQKHGEAVLIADRKAVDLETGERLADRPKLAVAHGRAVAVAGIGSLRDRDVSIDVIALARKAVARCQSADEIITDLQSTLCEIEIDHGDRFRGREIKLFVGEFSLAATPMLTRARFVPSGKRFEIVIEHPPPQTEFMLSDGPNDFTSDIPTYLSNAWTGATIGTFVARMTCPEFDELVASNHYFRDVVGSMLDWAILADGQATQYTRHITDDT